jgi:hypothetical protein
MSDLPTPEELGEKLKAGEITKEQAVEIMSERARREALGGLYGPPPEQTRAASDASAKAQRVVRGIAITTTVLALILAALLVWIALKRAG